MDFIIILYVDLFFFQAEEGIRVDLVTGVQTCALPISTRFIGEVENGKKTAQIGKVMDMLES